MLPYAASRMAQEYSRRQRREFASLGVREQRQRRVSFDSEVPEVQLPRHVPFHPQIQPENPMEPPAANNNIIRAGRDNIEFSLSERIFMIGARNFFVPLERPSSPYCVDCFKRAGFHISLILVVVSLFLLSNALLHPLHMVGREFFISIKYRQLFLADENYYPMLSILFVYFVMLIAGWTVHYTQKPAYDTGFFLYLNSSRILLVCGFLILVWQIWSHAVNYPNEDYAARLEANMLATLKIARENHYGKRQESWAILRHYDYSYERKLWDDTQSVSRCCGIKSFLDWLPPGVNSVNLMRNFSKYVPRSCCAETTGDSCEAIYIHKDGCLRAQLKGLTGEYLWIVNPGLFFVYFCQVTLYLLLGRVFSNTAATRRRGRIFDLPVPQSPEDAGRQNHHLN